MEYGRKLRSCHRLSYGTVSSAYHHFRALDLRSGAFAGPGSERRFSMKSLHTLLGALLVAGGVLAWTAAPALAQRGGGGGGRGGGGGPPRGAPPPGSSGGPYSGPPRGGEHGPSRGRHGGPNA